MPEFDPLAILDKVNRIGDHHRDRIAEMHHPTDSDRRSRRQIHRAAVALLVGRIEGSEPKPSAR
jgi:hypothetical protein